MNSVHQFERSFQCQPRAFRVRHRLFRLETLLWTFLLSFSLPLLLGCYFISHLSLRKPTLEDKSDIPSFYTSFEVIISRNNIMRLFFLRILMAWRSELGHHEKIISL
jgi:hypothetical protein